MELAALPDLLRRAVRLGALAVAVLPALGVGPVQGYLYRHSACPPPYTQMELLIHPPYADIPMPIPVTADCTPFRQALWQAGVDGKLWYLCRDEQGRTLGPIQLAYTRVNPNPVSGTGVCP